MPVFDAALQQQRCTSMVASMSAPVRTPLALATVCNSRAAANMTGN
jgi:hypothetical protein